MMLSRVAIRRFRGIRQLDLAGLGHINLLIGPNGCGKSTVLEAIYLLASMYADQEPFYRYTRQSGGSNTSRKGFLASRRNEYGDFPEEWWFNYENSEPIVISLEGGVAKLEMTRTGNTTVTKLDPPRAQQADELTRAFERFLMLDGTAINQREIEQAFMDRAMRLRLDRKLVLQFEQMYGLGVEDFTYSAQTQRLLCKFKEISLPIDSLGGGMRIALRLLLSALVFSDYVLLLEEFDVFQHKDSIAPLARALLESVTAQRGQILMTTHSLETVRAFAGAVTDGLDDSVRVIPLVRHADGRIEARALTSSTVRTLVDGGSDLRDIKAFVA